VESKNERNRFGKLAGAYGKYRRDYPEAAYEAIRKYVPNRRARVLDVGCGSGVATVPLAEYYERVVGSDKETEMIETARSSAPPNVEYFVASAEELPFPNTSFDLVTVAQAFHWFDQPRALAEMKRILKPNGMICIFRKRMPWGHKLIPDWIFQIIQMHAALPPKFGLQDDFSFLRRSGFHEVVLEQYPFEERYSVDEYLGFLSTHSTFILIPDDRKESYLAEIREAIQSRLEDGHYVVRGEIEMWFCSV
jgi:ubiquinone/menaquinone biosynthesis C-methylase UbiE